MKKTILSLLITLCPILTFASDYIYLESSDSDNTTDEYSDSIVPNPIDENISNLNSNQINKKKPVQEVCVVEQMPSFPGGYGALMSYINKNIKFPAKVCKQGRVVVSFFVEKDGSITNATVVRSVDPALDKEALRVIKSMPKWLPSKEDSHNVRVRFCVPVKFKLQ